MEFKLFVFLFTPRPTHKNYDLYVLLNLTKIRSFVWLFLSSSLTIWIIFISSAFLQWASKIIEWFSLFSDLVFLRYVFMRFIAENEHSLMALVAGISNKDFLNFKTFSNKSFWSFFLKILLMKSKVHYEVSLMEMPLTSTAAEIYSNCILKFFPIEIWRIHFTKFPKRLFIRFLVTWV